MMNEFEIIQEFFNQQNMLRHDVTVGIGDDAAVIKIAPNREWVVTTDTLVSGTHFFENANPYDIGFKALAVNLSDLAAMGATPSWFTLALTIPNVNEHWLKEFSRGLFDLSNTYQLQLIGGDLTRGPLSITIGAFGWVPENEALRRDHACPGDAIYVTHTLGDAALALAFLKKEVSLSELTRDYILSRLTRPTPRIHIGQGLRKIASAAIDVSDGLLADLGHILEKSKVGATLYIDQIPISKEMLESVSEEKALQYALSGGDDYELCFTVPEKNQTKLPSHCTRIGEITSATGLNLKFKNGQPYHLSMKGYQHF